MKGNKLETVVRIFGRREQAQHHARFEAFTCPENKRALVGERTEYKVALEIASPEFDLVNCPNAQVVECDEELALRGEIPPRKWRPLIGHLLGSVLVCERR